MQGLFTVLFVIRMVHYAIFSCTIYFLCVREGFLDAAWSHRIARSSVLFMCPVRVVCYVASPDVVRFLLMYA
jgi:hypothetical protein